MEVLKNNDNGQVVTYVKDTQKGYIVTLAQLKEFAIEP